MKTLTWYIIKEHVGPFLFALFTITFVFILNAVFKDLGKLLTKGVSFTIILRFFGLHLAWIAALAVPMAVLVASLMAFGRMAQDHEITAVKAGGINFYRLIAPILFISLLLAVGMERFNNIVLPEFNHQYKQLYRAISRKKPSMILEEGIFNKTRDYSMLVQKIDNKTNTLTDIVINDLRDKKVWKTITAKSGTVEVSEAMEKLIMVLYDGEIHEVNLDDLESYQRSTFRKTRIAIEQPNIALKESNMTHRGNREKSASMLRADIVEDNRNIEKYRDTIRSLGENELRQLFPLSYWGLPDSAAAVPAYVQSYGRDYLKRIRNKRSQIDSQIRVINMNKRVISSLKVEVHKKYSIPLTCIIFVLIGAPLGIMARQGGLAVGGGLSMIFFVIFWAFLIGGEQLADRRMLSPAVAMWLPNVLVGILGIYLMRKAINEAAVFDWEKLAAFMKKFKRSTL